MEYTPLFALQLLLAELSGVSETILFGYFLLFCAARFLYFCSSRLKLGLLRILGMGGTFASIMGLTYTLFLQHWSTHG